ncbi:MAG TPA: rhodanese-like domain-containing protein, partial [Ktedonobacteraceae bacterium]
MGDASREIMRKARQQVPEWTSVQVHNQLNGNSGAQDIVLVDVREKHEWDDGHIPGAIHVPRGFLELEIEEAVPEKSKKVVLYCAGGVRSLMAGNTLQQMGYQDVVSMSGGFGQWKGNGFEFEMPRTLTAAQSKRYSRHLL